MPSTPDLLGPASAAAAPADAAPRGGDPSEPWGGHARAAVLVLAGATALVAVAYASAFGAGGAPRWAGWLLAVAVPAALAATMVLGAARRGRVSGQLLAAFVGVAVLLAAAFALALGLPAGAGGGALGEPLLLGLPRRAAVVVYGVGLLPVFVLPVVYALTFDAQTLRAEDLERVRALAAERARGAGA
jgi:fatty acid desaturase